MVWIERFHKVETMLGTNGFQDVAQHIGLLRDDQTYRYRNAQSRAAATGGAREARPGGFRRRS
jgi:hypothetical protein